MTETNPTAKRSSADAGETPEDVATLYSWANLHGAKYRDFSSSRAEAREEARLRVEEVRAIEQRRLDEEAERRAQEEAQHAARLAAEAAEAARQAEVERLAEISRQAEAERNAVLAAQEAQRLAAQQRTWQPLVQPGQPGQSSQSFQSTHSVQLQPTIEPSLQPNLPDFYVGSEASPNPSTAAQFTGQLSPGEESKPVDASGYFQSSAADFNRGLMNRFPEASQATDLRPAQAPPSASPLYQNHFARPNDPFAPIASSVPAKGAAPISLYSYRDSYQVAQQPATPAIPSAPSYFADGEYANYSSENTNQSQMRQQPPAQNSAISYSNSQYQPGPFRAPNYEAPSQNAPDYQPMRNAAQRNAIPGNAYPAKPFGNSDSQSSSAPYVPQLVENYSPWQGPSQSETPQELYEQRESISRPAWLIPELVPEASSFPAPQQPTPPSHAQAQYSAGTMPSPTPTYSYQHPAPMPAYSSPSQPNRVSGFPIPPISKYAPQTNPSGSQFGAPQSPSFSTNPNIGQVESSAGRDSGQGSDQGLHQNSNQASQVVQQPSIVADTLLGSRDRISQRWYALKSVFDPLSTVEQAPAQPPARVPALAVFSLAGGVGKTSIVAALGRGLSSRGERVLLVDTATYGLLPFFFGARDQRPGMLRTFNPPGVSTEAPIQLVTLDPDGHAPDTQRQDQPHQQGQQFAHDPNQDWLPQEIARYSRNSSRILIDLPTASGATTRRILRMGPVVLVPVIPDMSSVVSVGAIESFFRHSASSSGQTGQNSQPVMPYYVLNQFDYSLPLHLDVREVLREQIGDRLLPFALRRNPAISEALAEGMTVMDYAPTATVAEDYANLAGWVRSISAPANVSHRGVRWSER